MDKLILHKIQEISELTDKRTIVIGVMATYLYSVQNQFDIGLLKYDYDRKLLIDIVNLKDLTDYYGGCDENKYLNKYELEIDGIAYDLYLENHHSLLFSYEELFEHSQLILDIRVPAIEHLLKLKLIAYEDRKQSIKGEKDKRDIIKLLYFADIKNKPNVKILIDNKFEFKHVIEQCYEILKDNKAFLSMCHNDAHLASKLKKQCYDCMTFYNMIYEQRYKWAKTLNMNIDDEQQPEQSSKKNKRKIK